MSVPPEAQEAIKTEEETLEGVKNSLSKQLDRTIISFNKERVRSRALTSELVAATRDEDKAMLASDEAVSHALSKKKAIDSKTLNKLLHKPYFARFVVEEGDNGNKHKLEYKLGFSANPDCRIVDWRKAPISRLYYEYQEGDEYSEEIQNNERNGTVILRNSVDIEKGILKKLSCRYGHFICENQEWKDVTSPGSRALHRNGSSYGELPNILSLITQDQFEMITEDADTALLVQGIAGSGKTTVALHRLAWLLHEDNSPLKAEECIIIVLSKVLKSYVSCTLPSMDVPGVRVLTFHEWAGETISHCVPHLVDEDKKIRRPFDQTPAGIERVKRSMAFLTRLEDRELQKQQRLAAKISDSIPLEELPRGIQKILADFSESTTPQAGLLTKLRSGIERGLEALSPGNPRYNGLQKAKGIILEVQEQDQSFEDEIIELLSDPGKILEFDETRLLDKELIGQAQIRAIRNKEDGVLDICDDALFLRLAELRDGSARLSNGQPGKYQHIVVDEVQDLSPVDLASLIAAVPNTSHLTLVGDTSQKIDDTSIFPGWKKLMEYWDFKDSVSRYVSLTVSHRSTLQIMRLADYIQKRKTVSKGRKGRVPIWFKCRSEEKGIISVINWLKKALEKYPSSMTAVICPDAQEAKQALSLLQPTFGPAVRIGDEHAFSFSEGIIVTDIKQVKGLEFFNVLIWNPSRKFFQNDRHAQNLLYVALTRAEENLCLVTWNRPSQHLPHIHSKLVRGLEIEEEEED